MPLFGCSERGTTRRESPSSNKTVMQMSGKAKRAAGQNETDSTLVTDTLGNKALQCTDHILERAP